MAEPQVRDAETLADERREKRLKRYKDRRAMLFQERSTWLSHWQEINDYIFPRRFRYLSMDRNKGVKRNDKVINNKPMIALRTMSAGMMAGITSPARPWFHYTVVDARLRDDPEVKLWLDAVEKIVREKLLQSNVYNVLHDLYINLGAFASPAMYVEEDDEDDIRAYLFPIGQYMLAASARGRVDTIYRDFSFTVGQLADEFGADRLTASTRQLLRDGQTEAWIEVVHAIEPNVGRDTGRLDSKNKPWRSVWYEKGASDEDQPLRERGYDEFPVMAPRWFVTGEDVYGSDSPGMAGLGDCKALQLAMRKQAKLHDKIVDPPMVAPASMKATRVTLLPGDTTYVPDSIAGQKFTPAMEVKPEASSVMDKTIGAHEYRIWVTFYADLFRMMQMSDEAPNGGKQPITAREVNERHEEKMLQLGPVLERLHDELLDPLLRRVFRILNRKGRIPPAPPQLLKSGRIKIEYISIMAQAQKLLGTASVERFSSFVGSLSAVNKEILDNVDFDKMIHEYADMLGIPASLLKPEQIVAQVRAARQAQQQAMAQAQQMQAMAQAGKTAAGASMEGDNMLTRLMAGAGGEVPSA